MDYHDLRVLYLYEFKLGHNGAEAARRINRAFGENTIGQRSIRRWFEKFRRKDFNLSKGPRSRLDEENQMSILNESFNLQLPFNQLKDVDKIFLFEYKLGHNVNAVIKCINEVFGEDTVDEATMLKWFDKFRSSGEVIPNAHETEEDEPNISKKHEISTTTITPILNSETMLTEAKQITTTTATAPLSKIKIKLKFIGKKKKKKDKIPML